MSRRRSHRPGPAAATRIGLPFALLATALSLGGCLLLPRRRRGPGWTRSWHRRRRWPARRSRGRHAEAITLYRRALRRARAIDDPTAIADSAYNLGACLLQANRPDEARTALTDSEAETVRAAARPGSGANLADVLLLEARAALLAGRPEDAVAYATRLTTDRASHPSPAEQVQADALKGNIACDARDLAAAQRELAQARRDEGDRTEPATRAAADGLEGRIRVLSGDPARAAPLFDRQAEALRQAELYHEMALALARAGRAWADAGVPALAADRMFRAARSLASQGAGEDRDESDGLLREAADAARRAGNAALLDRVAALRDDLHPTMRPEE